MDVVDGMCGGYGGCRICGGCPVRDIVTGQSIVGENRSQGSSHSTPSTSNPNWIPVRY